MIIQLASTTRDDTSAARRSLQALARSWGLEITDASAEATAAAGAAHHDDSKVIDPVAVGCAQIIQVEHEHRGGHYVGAADPRSPEGAALGR